MSEFLKYESLYLHYGSKLVLKNLSGSLESGKLYVVSGENGAGKTSLLNILSGKISANRGQVSGSKFNRDCIKALVGSTFLFSCLSVRENLEIFAESKVSDIIERFSLGEYADSLIRDLSQGYVQRTSLAVVLSSKADVILLDEPTNFLDARSKDRLLIELQSAMSSGKSLVVSSHEPEFFSVLSPRSLKLQGGEYV